MTTFTVYTDDKEQLKAVKAVLKALKVKFEISKDDKPYNPEFIAKIEKGRKDILEGKGIKMSAKDIDNLWK
jgi:hypothetical protein